MSSNPINDLRSISNDVDLDKKIDAIVVELIKSQHGLEAVEEILIFMERHPDWNFGSPGPLVHFAEKFYKKGYEELLLKSVTRRVTAHTAWMLNRIINGEHDQTRKKFYLQILEQAGMNPQLDEATKDEVGQFLSLHTQ